MICVVSQPAAPAICTDRQENKRGNLIQIEDALDGPLSLGKKHLENVNYACYYIQGEKRLALPITCQTNIRR
jgi:hypothetical protein